MVKKERPYREYLDLNCGEWQSHYHIGCGRAIQKGDTYTFYYGPTRIWRTHIRKKGPLSCNGLGRLCKDCSILKGVLW